MKQPQLDAYAIARTYLSDNTDCLDAKTASYVSGKIRSRDYASLASVTSKLDMLSFDVNGYRVLRQIEAFFKKNADFADDSRCVAAALTSFERAERLCRITNRRLDYFYQHQERLSLDMLFKISRAQTFISEVLGPVDAFLEELPSRIRVTSGAGALAPRSRSLPFMKFRRTIDATPRCWPYVDAAYRYYGYAAPKRRSISWNRVELVPKSWKTHRSIACEPTGNLPFQLAFDGFAKSKLKKFGIDLSDQERNQRLAKDASEQGHLSTLDLSMASDTLSINTVAWLLPSDWYKVLSDWRTPLYRIGKGKALRPYAKFSSMGNGATFALETLIFASLLNAVESSSRWSVYGDDMIIPSIYYHEATALLRFFGFVVNHEKSYFEGPFRESCGKDYYEGTDITPFYLRSTRPWDLPYAAHNVNGLAKISPYGALWDYLASFCKEAGLLKCAVVDDTQAGVHLHPYYAYKLELIRKSKRGILEQKQYRRKTVKLSSSDSRSLALWYLRSLNGGAGCEVDRYLNKVSYPSNREAAVNFNGEVTRYALDADRYLRRWVAWQMPRAGTPEDLFGFSELVLRES